MGVSQHDLLRIEAKDTSIILAIILLGYKHKYIGITMVGIGPPFEITANVHIEYIVNEANRRLYALQIGRASCRERV